MASTWLTIRGIIDLDKLSQGDDPRVGSGRDDSDGGGTLSATNGNKGSSLSKLGATFIPVVIYLAVCLILFIVLRRRCPRVYAPRCIPALRAPEPAAPALPNGWFNWILPFWKIPDIYVLNHGSLDGFFFLRFLKVLRNICFVGCAITWPILFPIHATGGRGVKELDLLTIGNVADPRKLFANALVAWLFFGFILFTIVRENIYYINIRQAFLSSPYYSNRLSSRTVLFTCIPRRYLDEARLRKLYGDSVRRVWIPKTNKALVNMVKEREQTALRLEKAEIQLIQKANQVRNKQLKEHYKNHPQHEVTVQSEIGKMDKVEGGQTPQTGTTESISEASPPSSPPTTSTSFTDGAIEGIEEANKESFEDTTTAENVEEDMYKHPYGLTPNLPDLRGSVAAQYLGAESRPHHRPLGNFGRRVDTIRWCRRRLIDLNQQIFKMRKRLKRGNGDASDTLPVAFVEFESQEAAQAAHQILAHHQPLHMAPRLLGIPPDQVVWSALRMRWWERIMRRFAILGLIVAAVVFWSIPSAFVGVISNIDSISQAISFLRWIGSLPSAIKGFLTGFIPALALSLFMALVPVILRHLAVVAGVPTLAKVELFTQTAYFAFQVVQVFLVTTLTSAASSAFFDVLLDPVSAKDLLAENLPTASNFYISYILIQCLAGAATNMLHPFDLLRYNILKRVAQIPRTHYRVWHTLRPTRWGRDFPIYANLGVIAICYSCISPLILIFAAVGMSFTHMVWRYNLIFVYDSDLDSKGLFYPRALTHLIVGLYLAQICLIGMFFLNGGTGPALLMILFLVFTALVHFSLVGAISPFSKNLPQTLALEEEIQEEEAAAAERAAGRQDDTTDNGAAAAYYDEEEAFGDEEDITGLTTDEEDNEGPTHGPQSSRGVEGAADVRSAVGGWLTAVTLDSIKEQLTSMGIKPASDPDKPPSKITQWLNPHIHADFITIRKSLMTIPETVPGADDVDRRKTYFPPEMWMPKPILWIPRDEARVSRQEVDHTRKSVPISDEGAVLNGKGRVVVEVEKAPFALQRLLL